MANKQENIRCLYQTPVIPVPKPPMYYSPFTESVKREYKLNRDCHRTMGVAKVQLNSPSQFLKKNTRKVIRPYVGKISF